MDPLWISQVRAAEQARDERQLAALFEQAVVAEGVAGASRSWLAALSGYDADAVTG